MGVRNSMKSVPKIKNLKTSETFPIFIRLINERLNVPFREEQING